FAGVDGEVDLLEDDHAVEGLGDLPELHDAHSMRIRSSVARRSRVSVPAMRRKRIATADQISTARKLAAMISWPWRVSAPTPMTMNSEVSFRLTMHWLPSGGIMRRKATGPTM